MHVTYNDRKLLHSVFNLYSNLNLAILHRKVKIYVLTSKIDTVFLVYIYQKQSINNVKFILFRFNYFKSQDGFFKIIQTVIVTLFSTEDS